MPSAKLTTMGKKHISTTVSIFGAAPKPRYSISMGESTIIGTVWVTTSIGYTMAFTFSLTSISMPSASAHTSDMPMPIRASATVTEECCSSAARSFHSAESTAVGAGST